MSLNDPAPSIIYKGEGGLNSLHKKHLDSYSLSDLLKLRDEVIANKKEIEEKYGTNGYKTVAGKIQSYIWKKRTHRKSGLIIPYSKDTLDE